MAKHNPPVDPWAEQEPKGRKAQRSAKKAAKKAAKADKTPWYKQIWQVFQMTRKAQPLIWLWMLCFVVGAEAIAVLLGTLVFSGRVIYLAILALPIGLMGAMVFLARRAERTAYGQIEGQPGAAFAALGQIKRGWSVEQEPIAVDPKTHDMVFRAVGRAGVVLIADGNPGRLARMVKKEQQRINRLAPGAKVIKLQVGNGEGQVPLRRLARKLQRLKPSMSKAEMAAVTTRLKSMGGLKLPMPKGIDPLKARPDRRAMRGR